MLAWTLRSVRTRFPSLLHGRILFFFADAENWSQLCSNNAGLRSRVRRAHVPSTRTMQDRARRQSRWTMLASTDRTSSRLTRRMTEISYVFAPEESFMGALFHAAHY